MGKWLKGKRPDAKKNQLPNYKITILEWMVVGKKVAGQNSQQKYQEKVLFLWHRLLFCIIYISLLHGVLFHSFHDDDEDDDENNNNNYYYYYLSKWSLSISYVDILFIQIVFNV